MTKVRSNQTEVEEILNDPAAFATETRKGTAELATQAEVDAGVDTSRMVTPSTLSNFSGIVGTLSGLSDVTLSGSPAIATNEVLKYNGSVWTNAVDAGLQNVVEDLSPQLGADLDTNGFNFITTSGTTSNSLSIKPGNITAPNSNFAGSVTIYGGLGNYTGNSGGGTFLQAGYGDVNGGPVSLIAGSSNTNAAGQIDITAGNSNTGTPGKIFIQGGSAIAGTQNGAEVNVSSGYSVGGVGGTVSLTAQYGALGGGNVELTAGLCSGISAPAGSVDIVGGSAYGTNGIGGDITLTPGYGSAPGLVHGKVLVHAPDLLTGVGSIGFRRDTNTGHTTGNTITLQASSSLVSDVVLTLPIDDGTTGQLLSTDGSGVLSWATVSSNNWLIGNGGNDFTIAPFAGDPGSNSIALGNYARADSPFNYSIAVGYYAQTSSNTSVVIGKKARIGTISDSSIAIGEYATIFGSGNYQSIAIGQYAVILAGSYNSIAIGRNAYNSGYAEKSISVGYLAQSRHPNAIAIGSETYTGANNQTLVGTGIQSDSTPRRSVFGFGGYQPLGSSINYQSLISTFGQGKVELFGNEAQFILPNYLVGSPALPAIPLTTNEGGMIWDASTKELKIYDGTSFAAVGGGAGNNWIDASGGNDFATPPNSGDPGNNSIAIGNAAAVLGSGTPGLSSVVIGDNATSTFNRTVAIGNITSVNGTDAVAIGSNVNALNNSVHIGGDIASSNGATTIVIGRNISSTGVGSTVIGNGTLVAKGINSVTIGWACQSAGSRCIAIGDAVNLGSTTSPVQQTAIGNNISDSSTTNLPAASDVRIGTGNNILSPKNLLNLYDGGKLEVYGLKAQFIMPNWATASIPAGVEGGTIWDTDTKELKVYDGTAFTAIGGAAANNWLIANSGNDFTTPPLAAFTNSIAVGNSAYASSSDSISIGTSSLAGNTKSIAIGFSAYANISGVAIGHSASAKASLGDASNIAIGRGASTTPSATTAAIAIGKFASTTARDTIVIGPASSASQTYQTVIGQAVSSTVVSVDVPHSLKIGSGATANRNLIHLHNKGIFEVVGTDAQLVLPNYLVGSPALPAIPLTTNEGGMIWDASTKELKIYNGTSFAAIGGGGGGGVTNPMTANLDTGGFSIITANSATTPNNITISPGNSTGLTNAGGDTLVYSGSGNGTNGSGGGIFLTPGSSSGTGVAGEVNLTGGYSYGTGKAGDIRLTGGASGTAPGGDVLIYGGSGSATGGVVKIKSGARGNNTSANIIFEVGSATTPGDIQFHYSNNQIGQGAIQIWNDTNTAHTAGNYVELKAPAAVGSPLVNPTTWTLTLPPTAGTFGQFLQTDGAGVATWNNSTGNNWLTANAGSNFTTPPNSGGATYNNIALGNAATVVGAYQNNIALGTSATVAGLTNIGSIAIGDNASISTYKGYQSVAIGNYASVAGSYNRNAIAIGTSATVGGTYNYSSIAVGYNAFASFNNSISIGGYSVAGAVGQTTIGYGITSDASVNRSIFGHGNKEALGYVGGYQSLISVFGKGKVELYGDEAQFILPNYLAGSPALPAIPLTTNEGGMIWDASTKELKIYDGTSFAAIGGGGGLFTEDADNNILGGTGAGANLTAAAGLNNFLGGVNAGNSITTGDNNVALCTGAGQSVTIGDGNVTIGTNAGQFINTGSNNMAIGTNAMVGLSGSEITGNNNVVIGASALNSAITTAAGNTAIGVVAGGAVTTGSNNTLLGNSSGAKITTGGANVCVGLTAGPTIAAATQSNKLYIDNIETDTPLIGGDFTANTVTITGALTVTGGVDALTSATTTVDVSAATAPTTGQVLKATSSTTATWQTGTGLFTEDADGNILGGTGAGANLTAASGLNNFLGGVNAGNSITTADFCVAVGNYALESEDTIGLNTAIGYAAIRYGASNGNTAIGYNALTGQPGDTLTKQGNTVIGVGAGAIVESCTSCVFIGKDAAAGTFSARPSGNNNVHVGVSAGQYFSTGASNTSLGTQALNGNSGQLLTGSWNLALGASTLNSIESAASNNTGCGSRCGFSMTTGSGNTFLGYNSAATITTGSGNIMIGSSAGPTTNQSNKLYIDNIQTDTPLIGGDFANSIVTLAGTLDLVNNDLDNVKTVTFNSEIANTTTTQTINWTAGQKQKSTITAATTITFTAPAGVCNLTLQLINGGAGAITWPVAVKWPGGTEPTWTTPTGSPLSTEIDIVSFYFDGTNYYGMAGLAFA